MLIDCVQALYVVRDKMIPWDYSSENVAVSTLAHSNYLENMRGRKLGYGHEIKTRWCILFTHQIRRGDGSYIENYRLIPESAIRKYCEIAGIPKEVFEEYAG